MEKNEISVNQPKNYRAGEALVVTVVVFFVGQFLGSLLVGLIPLIKGWNVNEASHWFNENVWAAFLTVAFIELATLMLLRFFMRRRQISFAGLGINRPNLTHLGYTLLGFGLYFVLYISVLIVALKLIPGLNLEQEQQLGFSAATTGNALILVFISLVILPPLVEEIVMRGFLFTGLRTELKFSTAMLITSALFALAHLPAGKGGLLWVGAIDTFMLSLVLCYLREKTGSLWPSIGVHAIKNSIAFIVLFDVLR
jgi:membrane protease YdiL (CAAX protease family)